MKEEQLTSWSVHTASNSPSNLNQTRLGKETMISFYYENIHTREGNPAFQDCRNWSVLLVLHLEKFAPVL